MSKNTTIDNLASEFKESLWLELDISGDKVMFGTVYRKGKSTPVNNKLLLEVISKVTRSYNKIVICGDFNYPEIDWPIMKVNAGPYSQPARFVDCLDNNFLIQQVVETTRARGSNKPSLLDLVITENEQTLKSPVVHEAPIGSSDHCVLTWDYLAGINSEPDLTPSSEQEQTKKYNLNKADFSKLKDLLREIDWEKELRGLKQVTLED